MRRILLLSCLALVAGIASAQGIRIYKTDGSSTDIPISEIDRIDCLPDLDFDATDYSHEVLNMYMENLGYTIPGERESRNAVSIRLVNATGQAVLTTEGGIRVRGISPYIRTIYTGRFY